MDVREVADGNPAGVHRGDDHDSKHGKAQNTCERGTEGRRLNSHLSTSLAVQKYARI
jgi:hypothetical protein